VEIRTHPAKIEDEKLVFRYRANVMQLKKKRRTAPEKQKSFQILAFSFENLFLSNVPFSFGTSFGPN